MQSSTQYTLAPAPFLTQARKYARTHTNTQAHILITRHHAKHITD